MNRRKVIRFYLTLSLKKRLWMVILPAVTLGVFTFVLAGSLRLSLSLTLVTALCITAGILWSSYRRHLDDFSTDSVTKLADPFHPDY